jgi:hypothetical protein
MKWGDAEITIDGVKIVEKLNVTKVTFSQKPGWEDRARERILSYTLTATCNMPMHAFTLRSLVFTEAEPEEPAVGHGRCHCGQRKSFHPWSGCWTYSPSRPRWSG